MYLDIFTFGSSQTTEYYNSFYFFNAPSAAQKSSLKYIQCIQLPSHLFLLKQQYYIAASIVSMHHQQISCTEIKPKVYTMYTPSAQLYVYPIQVPSGCVLMYQVLKTYLIFHAVMQSAITMTTIRLHCFNSGISEMDMSLLKNSSIYRMSTFRMHAMMALKEKCSVKKMSVSLTIPKDSNITSI